MAQRYCEGYGDKANKEPLITNVPDITENIYEKPGKNKKSSAILALALAASILTSGCGATANTNNSAEAAKAASNPNKAPITSTEKTPAASETTPVSKAETIPTVESLEILDDGNYVKIAKTIAERLNTILTIGMNNETYNKWNTDFMNMVKGSDVDTWSINYTAKNTEIYFKALCGPDLSAPNIAQFVQHFNALAASHLDRYLSTTTDDTYKTHKGVGGYPVFQYQCKYEDLVSYQNGNYIFKVRETDNNHETNLANGTWDRPSSDIHTVITCNTKTVIDNNGKRTLYITDIGFVEE
ncbi:hypothetical protein [Dehalobacter restrictus]|uniref:hypothetical protein n=1 Tax=Dehalobacter restrictus TaxID=55583 RepID=UPI00338DE3BE